MAERSAFTLLLVSHQQLARQAFATGEDVEYRQTLCIAIMSGFCSFGIQIKFMLRSFLMVGLGGSAGSMARYGAGYLITKSVVSNFPYGTLTINLVGSLLIGILFGLALRNNWMQGTGYFLLSVGFCGGFTTFSTFALDNITLLQKHQSGAALLYTLASVVAGLALCRVGIWMVS